MLALAHKQEDEVNFFTPEKLLAVAMEMAVENEFELDVGNSDGWNPTMNSEEGFVKSWREEASQEDKLTAAEEILSVFGYTLSTVGKNNFNVVLKGTKSLTFATLFDNYNEEGEQFDQGVGVRVEINGPQLDMFFFTDELNVFEKNYTLPDSLADVIENNSLFGEINIEKDGEQDQERMEIEIFGLDGNKGFATFHFNGEGTLYNDFYMENGDTEEWNGYFEIEDIEEAA